MDAHTLIQQFGGPGVLRSFVAAHSFVQSKEENWLRFKFKGSRKVNCLKVTLNSLDLYKMEFYSPRGKLVKEVDGVYCDMLVDIFEKTTGLYLHF